MPQSEVLPSEVRAILVDPDDHEPLEWIPELGVFRNRARDRDYPVLDGVARLYAEAAVDDLRGGSGVVR
jgi:uncharacterized protein YbaR (Trm112 family)